MHLFAFLTSLYAPLYCSYATKETLFVHQTSSVLFCINVLNMQYPIVKAKVVIPICRKPEKPY